MTPDQIQSLVGAVVFLCEAIGVAIIFWCFFTLYAFFAKD